MFNHNTQINRAGAAMTRAFQQAAEALIEQRDSSDCWDLKQLGVKRKTFKGVKLHRVLLCKGFNQPRIAVSNGSIAFDLVGSEQHDAWLDTNHDVNACTGPSWEKQEVGINPEVFDQSGWLVQKLHHEKAGVNAVLLNAALKWVGDGEITITQKPTDPLGPILITNVERLVSAVVMPCRLD